MSNKKDFTFNIEQALQESVFNICSDLNESNSSSPDSLILKEEVLFSHPVNPDFGDYSTNIAMHLARRLKTDPMTIAQQIKDQLIKDKNLDGIIDHADVVSPGYINIRLKNEYLLLMAEQVLNIEKFKENLAGFQPGRKVLVEHTSPNTNKSLHIGHLRNNLIGMALVRLLKTVGNSVIADCLYNDRGIHISKAMWGYLKSDHLDKPWRDVLADWHTHQDKWPSPETRKLKPDHFVEKFYGVGVKLEDNEANKTEMKEMLLAWESGDKEVRELWKKLNSWVYDGFAQTYRLIGSSHDNNWYESDFYQEAKETVEEGLKQGVFRKLDNGAVLTNLSSFKLTDNIIRRSDGTSMYFTQDVFLTKQKIHKFPSDIYLWVVGPEQQLHLQQVFAVCEQLGITKKNKLMHLWYGYVFLKNQGKMSSRSGTVVSIDSLVEESTNKALSLVEKNFERRGVTQELDKRAVAEKVGMAAIKFAILKIDKHQDIHFDWAEALNTKGNCGPYIQYTYTRCFSVLAKKKYIHAAPIKSQDVMTNEEEDLLRTIHKLPEIIVSAAKSYSPHLIAQYLFELSQKYNVFYEKCKIIDSKNEQFRIFLTAATSQALKFCLEILGIEAVERM